MTRYLLLLFFLYFATTAMAAPPATPPAAPGLPRPSGPRGDSFLAGFADPQPVARRVLPALDADPARKFPDTIEVVYLANAQPMHVRITLKSDGQSLDTVWQAHLRKVFAYFDRDHDGYLNRFETENIFSPRGIAGLLAGNYDHGAGDDSKSFAELDRDGDGRIVLTEFIASYDAITTEFIRPRSVVHDESFDRELTDELLSRLDENRDGQLSKAELVNAERILLALDVDENEALSAMEIRPSNMAGPQVVTTMTRPARNAPAPRDETSLQLFRRALPASLTPILMKKYDANQDSQLSHKEIRLEPAIFAKLDTNHDGQLALAELDGWRTLEPDYEAMVNVSHDPAKRSAELKPRGGRLPSHCELRTGENGRVVLRIGNQFLDISTASPAPGAIAQRVTDQLNSAFPTDQTSVTEDSIGGPQYQFLRVVFDAADANGDGKLTRAEFKAYLQLQEDTINLSVSASYALRRPSLFQLIDDNGDNQLGIRELRTAWDRLILLEPDGGDHVTKAALQTSASVRFGFTAFLNADTSRPLNPFAQPGGRKATGPLWFRKMDRNGDNDVSLAEFIGPREKFGELDTDNDGLISAAEADAADKKLRGTK